MDVIRRVRLRPYAPGQGPAFSLTMYDTGRYDHRGQTVIGYRFSAHESGRTVVLFSGEDFAGSPLHADDSDETVRALLSFLTLRPGDTDADHFAAYTADQHDFAAAHAEAVAMAASDRFGEG